MEKQQTKIRYNTDAKIVATKGLSFEIIGCGSGDRLALCLHGFPSQAICWRHQLPLLAKMGYRAWAPNQRGYGNSDRPARVRDYAIDHLLEDIAQIIDASGTRSTVLIAHDWGGLLAWFFAARRLRPIDALIILNAPHPACAAVAYRRWRQIRKAWYMAAAQIPWLPEWLLGLRNAWLVGKLMTIVAGSPEVFPPQILRLYRDEAARPGALKAMLNWYRALVRAGPPAEMKGAFPKVEIPTLVIWGEADAALDISCLDGLDDHVPNLTLRRLPGVSHWVQEEVPETVNQEIERFLKELASSQKHFE
jgi:pimeloyl-ACP methyl ester carboxylesterase